MEDLLSLTFECVVMGEGIFSQLQLRLEVNLVH